MSQDFAGLWTDGRYFLQAEEQIAHTGIELFKMGNEGVPTVNAFVLNHIKTGECLGFDGRTGNAKDGQYYAKHLREKGATVKGCYDLVDAIWQDRPPVSAEPAWLLDICYAGQSREDKIAAMREKLSEEKAEWLILTGLDDIAWLLNIRGNDVAANPVVL